MPWVPIAAAAISAAGAYAASSASASKGGTSSPSSMWQNMPGWAQEKYASAMQGMPGTTNVSFGGQVYPSVYGPFSRMGQRLWSPAGQNTTGFQPSGVSSALSAASPWALLALQQMRQQQYDPYSAQLQQTPYGNMYNMYGYPVT